MKTTEKNVKEAPVNEPALDSRARAMNAADWVSVEEVAIWDRNPKKRTEADIREAMGSLRRFGFGAPLVGWYSKRMLVAGHARRLAMVRILKQDPNLDGKNGTNPELAEKNRKLRESLNGPSCAHVPLRWREFTTMSEAEAYALRDNNDFGETDSEALGAILKDLAAGGTDIDGLGFSEDDMAKMFGDEPPAENAGANDQSSKLKDEFLVLVECTDEQHQLETIEALQEQGFAVRALV